MMVACPRRTASPRRPLWCGSTALDGGRCDTFADSSARANPAEVTWVDPDPTPPAGLLEAPHLTYLGSGDGVTVLLACGETTYVVQSNAVAVTLLDQGRAGEPTDEEESAAFDKACN